MPSHAAGMRRTTSPDGAFAMFVAGAPAPCVMRDLSGCASRTCLTSFVFLFFVRSQFVVVAVCTKFTAATIALKCPLSAISPLRAATRALQPTPSHFTPLHPEFLKVCVLSKCYFAASALLEQDLALVCGYLCTWLHVAYPLPACAPQDTTISQPTAC